MFHRLRFPFVLAALGLTLVACGGAETGGTGATDIAGTTGTTAGGSGGSTTTSSTTTTTTAAPLAAAPKLEIVMPMAGVLHVQWTTTGTCDFIVAERKDPQNPEFASAWEVAGTKTSHMDGDANQDQIYTYRLQCKVGEALSDYSNEMSGNPKGP